MPLRQAQGRLSKEGTLFPSWEGASQRRGVSFIPLNTPFISQNPILNRTYHTFHIALNIQITEPKKA